jgi:hypothetical protein
MQPERRRSTARAKPLQKLPDTRKAQDKKPGP